ncbi:anti-sigma factor family protein [Sorangium sp. So ce131]|uniref:anti-sigma factor family protein n=1 Tax=Sorangium sp. So ce131 TaxID=3133282 RepID=UPI003F6237D9
MVVTCLQLTEMITDQREGKLSPEQDEGIARHLAWCDRCRTYIRQMDLMLDALKKLPGEPLHEALHAALLARFQRRQGAGG